MALMDENLKEFAREASARERESADYATDAHIKETWLGRGLSLGALAEVLVSLGVDLTLGAAVKRDELITAILQSTDDIFRDEDGNFLLTSDGITHKIDVIYGTNAKGKEKVLTVTVLP